jgi:hypothetical protein
MTPPQDLDCSKLLTQLAARYGSYEGAWAAPLDGGDLLRYTLAAVLRAIADPWPADRVKMAVLTIIFPRTIVLTSPIASEYNRLMGRPDYIRTASEPVGDWVLTFRRAHSHEILSITEDGLWRAGADVNDAPHKGLDARARFVVACMGHALAPMPADEKAP